MSNEFWMFSLAIYANEAVAESCLAVQEELGLDVNVVLYAAWLASRDLQLNRSHLTALAATIEPWRHRVVLPLRALRRDLKGYSSAVDMRQKIKGLELESERRQQDIMWEFYGSEPALPVGKSALTGNLGLLVGPCDCEKASWLTLLGAISRYRLD